MVGHAVLVGLLLIGADGPRAATVETAADRITLRDGSVVLGLVTSVVQDPRGPVEFLVRRGLAERACPEQLRAWDRSTSATARLAVGKRRHRLEAWRRERAPSVGANDRIIRWIDHELTRSAGRGGLEPSILVNARVPRNEVRRLERRPAREERLLRLAWLCVLPEPESMPLDELKDALAARGYEIENVGRTQPAALDQLLPTPPEPEPAWLARRAATELAVDSDLRFIRFEDTVIADTGAGQPLAGVGLSTAFSEIQRLLDLDQGRRTDPLAEKLDAVAARGRIGAVVTRLEISPDLSAVTVQSTLWIRGGGRWVPFTSRTATVRPDDLGREAGKNLEADPQVQGAFRIVELLGLGAVAPEIKDRSLRIGAATERALGMARSALHGDLDALALPVLEPFGDDRTPDANGPDRVRQ
jgi:hypothetical protein